MPKFGENHVHPFLLSVFKSMVLLVLKIIFCTILVVIKPEFSIQSL